MQMEPLAGGSVGEAWRAAGLGPCGRRQYYDSELNKQIIALRELNMFTRFQDV